MTATKPVPVNAADLRTAFEYVGAGAPFENSAYICLDTGKILWNPDMADLGNEEDLPEELDTSDRYLPVPHKRDTITSQAALFCGSGAPGDATMHS